MRNFQNSILVTVVLIVVLGLSAVVYGTYSLNSNQVLNEFEQHIYEKEAILNVSLENAVADLSTTARFLSLFGCAAQCTSAAVEEYVTTFFETRKQYTQLRVLSMEGQEVLRWNSRGDNRAAERAYSLQDKTDRYYFRESRNLKTGGVYFSSMDYNVEQGQIELPVVPTVRAVTKVLIDELEYLVSLNLDLSNVIDRKIYPDADADADADALPFLHLVVLNNTDIDGDGDVDAVLPLLSSTEAVDDLNLIADHPMTSRLKDIELQLEVDQRQYLNDGYLLYKTERYQQNTGYKQECHFTLAAWIPDGYLLTNYLKTYSTLIVVLGFLAIVLVVLVWKIANVLKQLIYHERELQLRAEKQSQLFSVIGHELRTPLASIQMMANDMGLSEMKPHGAEVCRATDSLLGILDDLRFIARPERATEIEAVFDNPYLVVERSINSLAALYREKNIEVHFSANSEANTTARFGAQSLRQITTNLLKNAAIHSTASDVWISLQCTRIAQDKLSVELSIEDNGAGIDARKKAALFEAFVRGKSDADGTGLGLYIVKSLSQMLGGDTNYFDSSQGGAGFRVTFSVDIPAKFAEDATADELPLQGFKVLFAEDQLTLQKLTCKQLEVNQAEVTGVLDGLEALAAVEKQDFDIVLTDINMPNMNGYELTATLRKNGFNGIIIGLTAATIGSETEKLISLGANAVLQKPLNMSALRKLLFDLTK